MIVVFNKDFANKKKGDEFECDSQLASHLVHTDQVAEYKVETKQKEVKPNK
jgi:hypothetical protein